MRLHCWKRNNVQTTGSRQMQTWWQFTLSSAGCSRMAVLPVRRAIVINFSVMPSNLLPNTTCSCSRFLKPRSPIGRARLRTILGPGCPSDRIVPRARDHVSHGGPPMNPSKTFSAKALAKKEKVSGFARSPKSA